MNTRIFQFAENFGRCRRDANRGPRAAAGAARLLLAIAAVALAPSAAPGAEDGRPPLQYNRDIRPILADHCFSCHGPDSASRKAGLRLDDRDEAIAMAAIEPGDPDSSEMIRRVLSGDEDELMPPPSAKKPLSDRQKQLLSQWVGQGAGYQRHWSFIAPQMPPAPDVEQRDWPVNTIDLHVLAALERAGLRPSPQADRATLVRRVSYDLTGLPPTPAELDRFLADDSRNWYESMVDHYLAQPAFGERMALGWMDAARYGDTSVFHADGPRDMWPWRDWVIDAYNRNMPFDQFTIEQLAGDLLPDATPYQKIASGFNRNHATTDEGGAIAEEWRIDYVVDRVKTTSNVWLGISMECGQCHEHKFDPISQKEYYQFFAFFNQTTDPGMQTRKGNQAPVVDVPDPAQDAKVAELQRQADEIEREIAEYDKRAEEPFQKWLAAASAKAQAGEGPQPPADMLAHFPLDENQGAKAADAVDGKRTAEFKGKPSWAEGQFAAAAKLDGSNFLEAGNLGDFERSEGFSYGCWVKPQGSPSGVPIGKMNEGNSHRGWDLYIAGGQVAVHVINSWPANAIKVTTKAKIPADKWTHLFATYDGSGKAAGVKIFFDGKPQEWVVNEDRLSATIQTKVPLKFGRRHNSAGFKGLVDDIRLFARTLSETEVAAIAGNDPIGPLLATPAERRSEQQLQTLRTHYLTAVDESRRELQQRQQAARSQIAGLKKKSVTSMIMGEQEKPRNTYLLMRGHYASPDTSEVIEPGVPAALPPLPEGAPPNRLGLARWLVSPGHPLTARVTVNRYWSMIFGNGIVATPMDFGSQGAWPTHPELLDYLAVDFRDNGWDIKRMWKQILMSATYRQSSRRTPELAERDPENLLLARGPRFRLQGEMIRDTALQAAGLLSHHVGGPGVKPYQPPGLWNEVSLSGNVRFVPDKGEKLYRKSMYIYWKRSAPHPGMRIFDAPTREKCVVQRPRTNTPLQALYTMNGEQYVEASRAVAERMLHEGGESDQERIDYGFRLLTAQHASPRAVAALQSLLDQQREKYAADVESARELLSAGESARDESIDPAEHAAWTIVANVLLNMDATLTKY